MSPVSPKSRLLSHTVVALVAAVAGWMICDIARPNLERVAATVAGDASDSPGFVGQGSVVPPANSARSVARRPPPKEKPAAAAQFIRQADGSVVLPPELRDRFGIELSSLEDDEDRSELALLGFSEEQSNALFALAEEVKQATRAGELARAVPISKSDTLTILKIPPLLIDHEAEDARIRNKYEVLAGSRIPLVGDRLGRIFDDLSGEFRRDTVIACRRQGEDGKIDYEYYRIDPDKEDEITPDISRDELESRATSRKIRGSIGPDEEYEYLFGE